MNSPFLNDEIFEDLPDLIKASVNAFTGRERDIVLLSSLGVLSCCLPKLYGNYNGDNYSSHIYLFIVAPAASGKGRMRFSSILIEKIHQFIKGRSQNQIDDCKKENKGDTSNCPKLDVKIIPGNVSSSKVYSHLEKSLYGLLIFETEADSLTFMLKQDIGNFSDVLRKTFQHEKVSVSRAGDDKLIEINVPRLALVLSGTINQVLPLIKSKENGLFSRFLYYFFDEKIGWVDVSPNSQKTNYEPSFIKAGDEVFKMYENLVDPNLEPIEFKLTEEQWLRLNITMKFATEMVSKNLDGSFLSTVKRLGLILFRLCMVLSAIRNKDVLHHAQILVCEDIDFNIAEKIVKTLLDHSIAVFELFDDKKSNLTMLQMAILEKLPKTFRRQEAIEVGTTMNVPERTIDYNLNKWCGDGILSKVSNGVYTKKLK